MDWVLFTLILVGSIIACWVAQEFVMKKNIRLPKTAAVIGHLLYVLLLALAYIYL